MGGLDNFILMGHSFGGYTAGLYASQYPYFIKKLILLSPAGVSENPKCLNEDNNKEISLVEIKTK